MGVETVAKTRTYPDGAPLEPEKKDPRVRSDLVESLIFHKSEKDVVPTIPNFVNSIYRCDRLRSTPFSHGIATGIM